MKVLVVSGHPHIVEGLGRLLKKAAPETELLEATNLRQAELILEIAEHRNVDVVVLDATTPHDDRTPVNSATMTTFGFIRAYMKRLDCTFVGIATEPDHLVTMQGLACVPGNIHDLEGLTTLVLDIGKGY